MTMCKKHDKPMHQKSRVFFESKRVGFDTYPSFYLMLDLWYKCSPLITTILVAFFKKYLRLEYYNDEIIINTTSVWYLFEGFKTVILFPIQSIRFVKYAFSAEIWSMKAATRIMKYKTRVIKWNHETAKGKDVQADSYFQTQHMCGFYILWLITNKTSKPWEDFFINALSRIRLVYFFIFKVSKQTFAIYLLQNYWFQGEILWRFCPHIIGIQVGICEWNIDWSNSYLDKTRSQVKS